MKKRKYTLRRRAETQAETRERIVDAAMELHETLGPAATTVSALARKAGVQRLTVYRHFPTDTELLGACSGKWLGLHPPPDLSDIHDKDPDKRVRAILLRLYRYYAETESMWTGVYHDLEDMPALRAPVAGFEAYLAALSKELLSSRRPGKSKRLKATVGHAVQFSTWKSLAGQGLTPRAMADLAGRWIAAAGN